MQVMDTNRRIGPINITQEISRGRITPANTKLLDSDNGKPNCSDNNFNMVVINQLDCVAQNESDQFMACQYLDLLLGNTSLVIVTLTDHPSTLHLHPSLASRLSAGFLFQFPHGTSSSETEQ